ncbi:amylo-alpha-1,6-glucosidase [soil metagenome]
MDFSKNLVLKENYTFFVGDLSGLVTGGEHGLFNRDTRFLSVYAWELSDFQTLLVDTPRPDRLHLHHAELDPHRQLVAVKRDLTVTATTFTDTLTVQNTSLTARTVRLELTLAADFADLFEARGWQHKDRTITREAGETSLHSTYQAEDGLTFGTLVTFSETPEFAGDKVIFEIALEPKTEHVLNVEIKIENPLETGEHGFISYEEWRHQFAVTLENPRHQAALGRAVDDLRALLLFDEHGTVSAAGIPWFVAAFGRDALLTAYMLLPHAPRVAEGTLRFLAHYQATEVDDFRSAQPGKILHELRFGELSRTGVTPHSPYYGTVDATPLFVMLLHELYEVTDDLDLVKDLRPSWEAALAWMLREGDLDDDGFLEFRGATDAEGGKGLSVQSWKDSGDSMSHADGTLAVGALAVCEVQGYAYAAYLAAADFYEALGEPETASEWLERANTLQKKFHEAFWLPDLQTYALALDGEKRPLEVHSSDAGQLLWTGIVPQDIAPQLVQTLMSNVMWTGWGIRTRGRDEALYNPVSYHNGSVWPHDTALIAGGLARYGFTAEARLICEAVFDLAASQIDLRLPELVGGYMRTQAPPVPYPTACRPQAWDAAALVYLSGLTL